MFLGFLRVLPRKTQDTREIPQIGIFSPVIACAVSPLVETPRLLQLASGGRFQILFPTFMKVHWNDFITYNIWYDDLVWTLWVAPVDHPSHVCPEIISDIPDHLYFQYTWTTKSRGFPIETTCIRPEQDITKLNRHQSSSTRFLTTPPAHRDNRDSCRESLSAGSKGGPRARLHMNSVQVWWQFVNISS